MCIGGTIAVVELRDDVVVGRKEGRRRFGKRFVVLYCGAVPTIR